MSDTTNYTMIEASDEDYFEWLNGSLDSNPWLNEVEEREEVIEALSHVKVSEETRTQCLAELAAAKQRNWRISR